MLNRIRRFGFRLLYNEMRFHIRPMVSRTGFTRSVAQLAADSHPASCPRRKPVPSLELAHGTGDSAGRPIERRAIERSRSTARALWVGSLKQKLSRNLPLRKCDSERGRLACPFNRILLPPLSARFRHLSSWNGVRSIEIRRVLQRDASAVIVLSGLVTGRGLRARFIRCLYRLTRARLSGIGA